MANDCQTNEYFVNLYNELQQLKSKQKEAHTLDAPTLDDIEDYMVSHTDLDLGMSSGVVVLDIVPKESLLAASTHLEVALLNSATIHTILRNLLFFSFTGNNTEAWQVCQLHTIARRWDFKFHEGRKTIVLPGDATLLIDRAMYASSTHRNFISFKDLWAHGIHTFTMVKDHEEALELMQGLRSLPSPMWEPLACMSNPLPVELIYIVDFKLHLQVLYLSHRLTFHKSPWALYFP